MSDFLASVFAQYSAGGTNIALIGSKGTVTWSSRALPASRYVFEHGQRCYCFDLASAQYLLRVLVQHAYVIVGDQAFRQCRGIPMGINPAVYLANYYLFMYELRFVQQLLQMRSLPSCTVTASRRSLASQLLRASCWTVRYIDDIWSIVPRHSTIAL